MLRGKSFGDEADNSRGTRRAVVRQAHIIVIRMAFDDEVDVASRNDREHESTLADLDRRATLLQPANTLIDPKISAVPQLRRAVPAGDALKGVDEGKIKGALVIIAGRLRRQTRVRLSDNLKQRDHLLRVRHRDGKFVCD